MKTLPEIPSELLRLALDDLKVIEETPGYKINMCDWHYRFRNNCSVCLAGAVMANTLKADFNETLGPSAFEADTRIKLFALDELRKGNITGAAKYLPKLETIVDDLPYVIVRPYDESKEEFKEDIGKLIGLLKELEC